MGVLSQRTRDLAGIVLEESARVGVPPGCMMRLVERESQGVAGLKGKRESASGWPFGLTQITPIGLAEYNRLNPAAPISEASLMGTDAASARIQIRGGCFLWGIGWREYSNAPNGYERAALADLAYAKGGRALRELIQAAAAAGYPATLNGLRSYDPTWTETEDPFGHAAFVAAGLGDPPPAVGSSPLVAIGIGVLAGLGLLLLLLGWIK